MCMLSSININFIYKTDKYVYGIFWQKSARIFIFDYGCFAYKFKCYRFRLRWYTEYNTLEKTDYKLIHLSLNIQWKYRVSDSWVTKQKVVVDWVKLRRKVLYHFAKFAIIIKK